MTVAAGNVKTLRSTGATVTVLRSLGGDPPHRDWLCADSAGRQFTAPESELRVVAEVAPSDAAGASVAKPDWAYANANLYFAEDAAATPATVTDSGADPVTEFVDLNDDLPEGFTLNAATGAIGGTPTTEDTVGTAVVIRGYNASRSNYLDVTATLHVGDAPTLAYAASPLALQQGVAMAAANPTFAGDGTPAYAAVAPGLPDGMVVNAGTGIITGTPTDQTQDRTTVIRVTTEYGTVDANVVITIAAP